jgi:hypothetical protein
MLSRAGQAAAAKGECAHVRAAGIGAAGAAGVHDAAGAAE